MPFAQVNGVSVHYQTAGSGPPILMMGPGGMDSAMTRWADHYFWKFVKPIEIFSQGYTTIPYDRREAGQSSGRIERLSFDLYAREAVGLLDHLGIQKAFAMGSCMGSNLAMAFGAKYPERVLGLILYWPTGGTKWRMTMRKRFDDHAAFVAEQGLKGVVARAKEKPGTFMSDAALGPWGNTLSRDPDFAEAFLRQDQDHYLGLTAWSGRTIFDRDTALGPEAEELMGMKLPAIIIPGNDANHSMSAAWYAHENIPNSQFHNVLPQEQTPEGVTGWIKEFLLAHR